MRMSAFGTSRTSEDVRLESAKWAKADIIFSHQSDLQPPIFADSGAQVLPPAGATVPPWLPAKSARVSNLPVCCALGPPASAVPCSCRREPCTGRSAWLPLGRACLSALIEHRSGESRAHEFHRSFLTIPRRRSSFPRLPLALLVTLSPATTACPPSVTFTC